MTEVVVDGLQMYGVDPEGKKAYSLNQLYEALNEVCGPDASALILERVEKRLLENP